jgi:uncharacterized membrane protein YgcG
MKTAFRLICIALASLWLATGALAEEAIEQFDAQVQLSKDGSLLVTETIRVRGEDYKIRRGIYREFPLVFEDASGRERQVGFEIVSVTRDGQPEDYRLETASRATRVYIGNANRFLGPSTFTYRITYRTDRQVRFFDTHDELFWNVTGNFWDFPILNSSAEFRLPDGARAEDVAVFTGAFGSSERNASASIREGGARVVAAISQPLRPREGWSVAIRMPVGSVIRPTSQQELAWFWRDNRPAIISFASFLFLALYYFWAWNRVGRDPAAGVIVPRWDAPDGISPALVHYIENKGLSGNDSFSAALLSLAVKGYVTLEELTGKDMQIQATGKIPPSGSLPVGEQVIYNKVSNRSGGFRIDKANGKSVVSLAGDFRNKLYAEHRNKYFVRNLPYALAGVAMSIAAVVLSLSGSASSADAVVPVLVLMFVAAVFAVVFGSLGLRLSRAASVAGRIGSVIRWVVLGFILFNFLPAFGGLMLNMQADKLIIAGVAGIVMLNVLFWYLLGAPTPLGRRLMDGIEGLKTYINLAEKDRLNLQGAPAMSPQHFETVLPYAVALGLEKPWSRAFEAWMATAAGAAAAASYSPGWFHGSNFSGRNIGSSMGSVADTISSSMTNAAPAPKSSSSGFSGGGGGGFSGGGGGGGGGGGW